MRVVMEHEYDQVKGGLAPAIIAPIVTTAITWAGRTVAAAIAANSAKELAEKYYENEEKKRQDEYRRQVEEIKRRERDPCSFESTNGYQYSMESLTSYGK